MMQGFVGGVGMRGPGLPGWVESIPVLTGSTAWRMAELSVPRPALLPPNEYRRAGLPVRLALSVAEEAVRMAGLAPDAVRGVFASGNGEGALIHEMLATLASPEPTVSPTQFHNSVHNAVAGYWAMGAGSRRSLTCLGAHDDTLAAALLKALAEVSVEQEPVLCCVYDVPIPGPLGLKRPTAAAFAMALVLLPQSHGGALARLSGAWRSVPAERSLDAPEPYLPWLAGNPAAQGLPLLAMIAARRAGRTEHELLGGSLTVDVAPCSTAAAS